MTIVSISLNEKILEEINRLQKESGFSGRSEVIRAGVRMLLADSKEKEKLTGKLKAVLLVVHNQKVEDIVTDIKHEFEDIVSTQIHAHLKENKCLEIFILDGDANRIKKIVKLFQTSGKIEQAKLIIS